MKKKKRNAPKWAKEYLKNNPDMMVSRDKPNSTSYLVIQCPKCQYTFERILNQK